MSPFFLCWLLHRDATDDGRDDDDDGVLGENFAKVRERERERELCQ